MRRKKNVISKIGRISNYKVIICVFLQDHFSNFAYNIEAIRTINPFKIIYLKKKSHDPAAIEST